VGESAEVMLRTIAELTPALTCQSPVLSHGRRHASRYPRSVARGIDMFDCVLPTRTRPPRGCVHPVLARSFLKNARHADDPRPLDEMSTFPATRTYSAAYLHHLIKSGEFLGPRFSHG